MKKITQEHINSKLRGITYTLLPSGRVLVCEITLENGFTVRGESAVLNPADFDMEIGKEISFRNAVEKVLQLEAYLLQEKLYKGNE